MNVVVVDFQGFKDEYNQFVVKELAFGSIREGRCVSRYLFKSPFEFHYLPRRIQLTNLWLTRNYHGLEWYDGTIEYDQLSSVLLSETMNFKTIVCKGLEKSNFLSRILNREVVNLDKLVGRRLSDMPVNGNLCNHGGKCAVENVLRINQWMQKVMPLFESYMLESSDGNALNGWRASDDITSQPQTEPDSGRDTPDRHIATGDNTWFIPSRTNESLPLLKEEDDEDWMDGSSVEEGELTIDDIN